MRQVCITGIGIVSAIGNNCEQFLKSLRASQSGIRALGRKENAPGGLQVAGVVDINFADYLPSQRIPGLDRVSLLALVAARQAVDDAARLVALPLTESGVHIGTGIGGVQALELAYEEFFLRGGARVKPLTVVQAMNNAPAAHIAMAHGCHGPTLTFSTACSSSAIAIGEAYRAIKHGYADTMLAGGTEAMLVPGSIRAWEALRTLAIPDASEPSTACRPFAKDRTGLVLAEGAAVVVLEEAERAHRRGAHVYGTLSGYGSRTDATHITKPDAAGQAATMRAALDDAGLNIRDIDYINAHGTATAAGDVVETAAIKAVFGENAGRIAISSTKSMHGHVMGATGAVEFVAALMALNHDFIPPTINLHKPDPECDLDYVPNHAREGIALRHVMSNSFAFGGSNAVLIASRR
jgi:3-oxoacyl-[acyl-carrier-protein] synthase II